MIASRLSSTCSEEARSRPRGAQTITGDRPQRRVWAAALCGCLVLGSLWLAGCVSKAKAQAQARQAFLAGQTQALMRQQPSAPSVTLMGEVHNPVIPWTEDLTLAKAVVAAEYYGRGTPRAIYLVRNGRATSVDPATLLGGQDIPLEPGDIVDLRN